MSRATTAPPAGAADRRAPEHGVTTGHLPRPRGPGPRVRRHHVDAGTVKRLGAAADRLRWWDTPAGAPPSDIATARRAVLTALELPCPSRLRGRAYASAGEILHVIGYMAFDRGDLEAARSGCADTLDLAGEAGGSLALSLTHRARMSLARTHLTRYRDNTLQPHRAIEWATGADEPRLTHAERALAWQVKARAHAVLGNARAATLAVERATEHRGQASPDHDAPWVTASGEAEHLGDTGHALADLALAKPDIAGQVVRDADARLLAAVEHPRAHDRTRLLSCLMAAALSMRYVDPNRGVEISAPALQLTSGVPSAQVTVAAERLRRECRPHLHHDEVRWLHDELGRHR